MQKLELEATATGGSVDPNAAARGLAASNANNAALNSVKARQSIAGNPITAEEQATIGKMI